VLSLSPGLSSPFYVSLRGAEEIENVSAALTNLSFRCSLCNLCRGIRITLSAFRRHWW